MSVQAILEVKDGDVLAALRRFLRQLLEMGIVDALLVPLELPSGLASARRSLYQLESPLSYGRQLVRPALGQDSPHFYSVRQFFAV